MQSYNIHHAKTHLSALVDKASAGEAFIIAKAGKPLVKVVPLDAPAPQEVRRFGFMAGEIEVPPDFDSMGADAIAAMFYGDGKEDNDAATD